MNIQAENTTVYKFKALIEKKVFYNKENNYGIYAFMSKDDIPYAEKSVGRKNKIFSFGTLVGVCPELVEGLEYEIEAEMVENKKYGKQFAIISTGGKIPTNFQDKLNYLKTVTSEDRATILLEKYPDIIQTIAENPKFVPDFSELKGIKETTFKKIRDGIIASYGMSRLISFLNPLGITQGTIQKIFDLFNQNMDLAIHKIKENPYYLLHKIPRLTFPKIDAFALKLNSDFENSTSRVRAAINYVIRNIGEDKGDTLISIALLKKEVEKILPGKTLLVNEILRKAKEKYDADTITSLYCDGVFCGSAINFFAETYIYDKLIKISNEDNEFHFDNYDAIIEETNQKLGFELSDEQQEIIKIIAKHNVVTISGKAGCVDCDTEFFNGRIWKKISEYDPEKDLVLQYNEDGTSELVVPNAYIKNEQNTLYHMTDGANIDQCISEVHKVVYRSVKNLSRLKKGTFSYFYKKINKRKEVANSVYFESGFKNNLYSKNLTEEEIQRLYDKIKLKINNAKEKERTFTSMFAKTRFWADKIQFICANLGYNSYIYPSDTYKGFVIRILTEKNMFKLNNQKIQVNEYKTVDGYEYCFNVPSHMLVLRRNGRIFVTGNSGKTSVVKSIVTAFENKRIEICALSAKAAQRAKEVTGHEAATIHRLLGYDGEKFARTASSPLECDILILDEASMVNTYLFYSLLNAVPEKCKVVIVGDHLQLPPIGAGAIFYDLLNINNQYFKNIKLSTVYRQAQDSGIVTDANIIRVGNMPFEKIQHLIVHGKTQDMMYIFRNSAEEIQKTVIELFLNYVNKIGDVQDISIISPRREKTLNSCKVINEKLLDLLIPDNGNNTLQFGEKIIRLGARVINIKNSYMAFDVDGNLGSLLNGETGTVTEIDLEEDTFVVTFDDDRKYRMDKTYLSNMDLAYCLTVHKKQGDQSKVVIFAIDNGNYKLLSCNSLYTGITRAEKKCIVVADPKSFSMGVKNLKEQKRNTFLGKIGKVNGE